MSAEAYQEEYLVPVFFQIITLPDHISMELEKESG